jgi:RHS repeat-associated protein
MYIGGILEKVTTSAGTDYRHMIRAGGSIIIVSRQSGGTNTTNYVTSDHLGSSSAVTNSAGAVLMNSSFGAFGARRGANWSASPSAGDWTAIASTTRRGYTEHSMLDNVNFIHMNGRVQDPLLGRFASADPLISNPEFTQSFNRYSYVSNNPLSIVDPSGFKWVWIQHWCPPSPPDPHPELPSIDVHGFGCGEWQQIPDGPWAPPPDPKGPTEQPPAGPPAQPPQEGAWNEFCSKVATALDSRLGFRGLTLNSDTGRKLLAQYFRSDATPYQLSDAEWGEATNFVNTFGSAVLGTVTTTRADGLAERRVDFGKIPEGAPVLAGVLGSATGIFNARGLVSLRDSFNFDLKDRGDYPSGPLANTGVRLIRADAALCGGGNVSIPVTGGAQ